MPFPLTGYRVFIASPSGLQKERQLFRETVESYNKEAAVRRGAMFEPVGWEDTLGGVGRPQELINEELKKCDYFVLLLWDQWGSPTEAGPNPKYTSGTEEEFRLAMTLLEDATAPMRQVTAFFKAVDPGKLADPGPQLQKVLNFKRQLEAERSILFTTFDDPNAFEQHLRRHLARWLYDHEHGATAKPRCVTPPADSELALPQPAESIPLPQTRRNPLLEIAGRLANEGALTDAEALYARAIASGTSPDAFDAYGRFLVRVGRLAQAEAMFERLIELSESAGEEWKAMGYTQLGRIRRLRGDLLEAERLYSQALEINQRLNRKEGVASILASLGILNHSRGDLNRAEEMTRKAVEINLELKRDEGLAVNYGNLGAILLLKGHLDEAEESLRKAVEINERINQVEGLAANYANLGGIYKERGDLNRAEVMILKAIKLNEKLGRMAGLASNFGSLADIFLERGETKLAEEMLAKAIDINDRLSLRSGLADNYDRFGELYLKRGDLTRAEETFRKALELNQKLGCQDGIADTYQGIGLTYAQKGELVAARSMLTAARDLFAGLGMSLRAKEAQAHLDALGAATQHA
jgi:Flp pilus assembly protein TadD, contains TPR repeats